MTKIFFKWTRALSVGMGDIDAQHRYFISLINMAAEIYEKKDAEKSGPSMPPGGMGGMDGMY